jgi:hypothetical protein
MDFFKKGIYSIEIIDTHKKIPLDEFLLAIETAKKGWVNFIRYGERMRYGAEGGVLPAVAGVSQQLYRLS